MTHQTTARTARPLGGDSSGDSILVRITLDAYDFANPSQKQTQVFVQIPEVARVSYMLPASTYHVIKDWPWPKVLVTAQEHYAQSWVVDPSSAVGRQAVMEWLRDPTNRDEMQAAYELDQARRSPITRRLLEENGRVLSERDALRARVAELEARLAEYERPADEDPIAYTLTETAPLTVFRASHDSIVMGLYTTREAAQAHCEAKVRQEEPAGSILHTSWSTDDIGPDAEYELHITPTETGGLIRGTGYVVTPLEVAAAYDEEADA